MDLKRKRIKNKTFIHGITLNEFAGANLFSNEENSNITPINRKKFDFGLLGLLNDFLITRINVVISMVYSLGVTKVIENTILALKKINK